MAPVTLTNHLNRIEEKVTTIFTQVEIGDIIQFTHINPKSFDKLPLVFILQTPINNYGRRRPKIFDGINLNYLSEPNVQFLLKEKNLRYLTRWSTYKIAFRSYSFNNIGNLKKVTYITDEDISRRRRDVIQKDKVLENEIEDLNKDIKISKEKQKIDIVNRKKK